MARACWCPGPDTWRNAGLAKGRIGWRARTGFRQTIAHIFETSQTPSLPHANWNTIGIEIAQVFNRLRDRLSAACKPPAPGQSSHSEINVRVAERGR